MILWGTSIATATTGRTEADLVLLAESGAIRVWHDSNGALAFHPDDLRGLPPVPVQPPLMVVLPSTWTCLSCGREKPLAEFERDTDKPGALIHCRTCAEERADPGAGYLLAAPILGRLRMVVGAGTGYERGGVKDLARRMAYRFGGKVNTHEDQIGRLLRGETEHLTPAVADRLALAVGSSAAGFWGTEW